MTTPKPPHMTEAQKAKLAALDPEKRAKLQQALGLPADPEPVEDTRKLGRDDR